MLDLFPDNDHLHRWIRAAGEKVAFQGLPARICWLGYGERDKAGVRFNELVAASSKARCLDRVMRTNQGEVVPGVDVTHLAD